MANPRKFSEKIALHTHRQAEETARFEQIMREVSAATSKPAEDPPSPHSPGVSTAYRPGSRTRSPVGPIRRPHDRRLDTSPYSSGTFLSPPPDTSWRRANSDSALHQSTIQQGMNMDRNDSLNRSWMMPTMNGPDRHDGRPRSSYEGQRVPGINIHHSSHDPSMIQIPMNGNNTGSLPDLTNVDFMSPIHAPLDADQDSSQYSSNHLSVPVNSRFMQQQNRKNVPLDNKSLVSLMTETDFSQIAGIYQQQQQCSPTPPSPTLQQGAGYRSPRPSPQSSPSLGGRHSAPCSPGAPSPSPNDYHMLNHPATFQQHFEQLSMCDQNPVSPMSYVDQSSSGQMQPQSHQDANSGNIEIISDGGYYSTSPQLVYQTQSPGLHTTPNTPTSIPDIILTDYSAADDLLPDSLKEGLGSLDFDEFQILSNPSINLPDSVEDNFRLDRL